MRDLPYEEDPHWKNILELLFKIREEQEYTTETIDFIREQLQSFDDRIRGAAALVAGGCLLEAHILDLVTNIAQYDDTPAIRKAAIQSLQNIIYQGIMQNMEDEVGFDTAMDDVEEWDEMQTGNFRDHYLAVKHLLINLLEYDEDITIREVCLSSLADLSFLPEIRQKITEFFESDSRSSQLVALHSIGKYPQYWEGELEKCIHLEAPKDILKEAVSASYSSTSALLAEAVEGVLKHPDPEVLRFALLALANINKSKNLMDILQRFSLHENPGVQEAARDGIELCTKRNFSQYMKDDLGMEE